LQSIEGWLRGIGFGEYPSGFVENDIDWTILRDLACARRWSRASKDRGLALDQLNRTRSRSIFRCAI